MAEHTLEITKTIGPDLRGTTKAESQVHFTVRLGVLEPLMATVTQALDYLKTPSSGTYLLEVGRITELVDNFLDVEEIKRISQTSNSRLLSMVTAAEEELMEYQDLEYGWDSYFGVRFSSSSIGRIKNILDLLLATCSQHGVEPSELTPGLASDGSLDLEVQVKDKYLCFTSYPNSKVLNVTREYQGNTLEYEIPDDEASLEEQLTWLVS